MPFALPHGFLGLQPPRDVADAGENKPFTGGVHQGLGLFNRHQLATFVAVMQELNGQGSARLR